MTEQELKKVLLKFRGEPASTLPFAPCIEHLIDDEYCQNLSEMLRAENTHWEQHRAGPNLGAMLPNEPGLYMFVWQPKFTLQIAPAQAVPLRWVIYVGKAGGPDGGGTIQNRYKSEYAKYVSQDASCLWDTHNVTRREAMLARYLTLRPLDFWYLTVSDAQEIQRIERKLIKLLRPPLNQQHGMLRVGKPIPVT